MNRMATKKTARPRRMHTRAMDRASTSSMRAYLERVLEADFGGNQAALATAAGVTPSEISQFRREKIGGGMRLAKALADLTCVPLDVVIGRTVPVKPAPAPAGA